MPGRGGFCRALGYAEPDDLRVPSLPQLIDLLARRFGDLKLFEPITMLRLSRYATAKSAVVYGLSTQTSGRKGQRIRVLGRTAVG